MENETRNKFSRRDFLGKLGLAVGGIAAASALPATALGGTLPANPPKGVRAKRVVMLSLDGICVEGFKQAKTPHLDALLKQGALSLDTRVQMPSVTMPNWMSHLSGSGPEQHGVFNNGYTIAGAKKPKAYPPVARDKDGYYPSVFQVLKENVSGCRTAFYWNWKPLINPYNQKHFDEKEYLDNDEYAPYFAHAFDFVKKNKAHPTVVFLYDVHTDHAGHKHGWMSPEYIRSIEEADEQIGVFIDKMKAEKLFADTHFFFLTDHGGIGKGHGGTTPEEMIVPWGVVGPGIRKNFEITEANYTVNTATTILHLFGVKRPTEWTGEVPSSIFA